MFNAQYSLDRTFARICVGIACIVVVSGVWLWYLTKHDPKIAYLSTHGPARWILYPQPLNTGMRPRVELDTRFRRSFDLVEVPDTASLSVRAFTRCEILINGEQIRFTNQDPENWKRAMSDAVTHHLRTGENLIEAVVYNDRGPPALWLSLETPDEKIDTDDRWEASLVGAIWQAAQLASEPAAPSAVNLEEQLPRIGTSLQRRWPLLLILAAISSLCVAALKMTWRRFEARPATELARMGTWAVVAIVVVVTTLWALLFWNNAPSLWIGDGFDADGHLQYIQYLIDHKRLPWPNEGWSMYHPPLFYFSSAMLLKLLDLSAADPAASGVLRCQTLLIGLFHLLLICWCLRLVFPNQPLKQALGIILAGFLAMHLYMFQYLTNETLVATLASASIALTLRTLCDDRPTLLRCVALGVCLGGAMLTKYTALLVVLVIFAALFARSLNQRKPSSHWLGGLGVTALVMLAVCGWRYAGVWWKFGNPFVGSWDPRSGYAWWQDPGYLTDRFVLRFGRSLVEPFFSGQGSVIDGIYSTLWGDGLIGGSAQWWAGPPWNHDLTVIGYWLALLPTVAILLGTGNTILKFIRKPNGVLFILSGLALLVVVAIFYMALHVPGYSKPKAFYGMVAVVPFCAMGAWGLNLLMQRGALLRWGVLIILGTWALNAYATFWIPRNGERAQARLAQIYAAASQQALAERHLQAAIELNPQNAEAQLVQANLLRQRGQRREAIAQLRRIQQQHPDHANTHLALAVMLERYDLDLAIEHASMSTDLVPEHPHAWRLRGVMHVRSGEFEQAIPALRQALRINSYSLQTHEALTDAYRALGADDRARQQQRRAEKIQNAQINVRARIAN